MISSFDGLLEHSMENPTLVAAMKAAIAGFPKYRSAIPFEQGGYTRTLLRKTPEFELVAMQWAPGSKSPIHDHGSSRCWVAILEGELHVENYDRLDDGFQQIAKLQHTFDVRMACGQLDHRLDWRELHRVSNTAPESTFSLQLYAAPQTQYTVIDGETMVCSRALPTYDSIFDL
jgi:cysteine dioxygenase